VPRSPSMPVCVSHASVERTRDAYTRLGPHWVPTGRRVERAVPGQPLATRELRPTNLEQP
jgi:hypothetical protein